MLRSPRAQLAAALVVLALGACGGSGGASDTAAGAPGGSTQQGAAEQAAVLVTRDCGKEVVVARSNVPTGQTALQSLDRVADIETDSGGKFVTAIEGVEQDDSKKLAWLYYVNGKAPDRGAAEVKLSTGEVEWWDLHNYEQECPSIPAEAR